ncbi:MULTISPECIES: hypothetical protein [unclassified Streptomyces]|uniref:hypothetical protein n=1 Tax=unclassified Streptomyces TaxID=2593676 RepID=UPI002257C556|nr:hypothetical protein [Streptomyces sp. NBC_00063]MCX5436527.1 hypothetical protein [Streptomyces sp. NBC_00063]WSE14298.1 hypothetical protein OG518_13765 [Streptomyces sp. NBC_01397]
MRASAFVYPWDVNGDPEAAGRIAGLGVQQVTLASAYHSTRALTPRHPSHRVVTAEHAAVLYPPGDRWRGRDLRPYEAGDWAPGDAFGQAAEALADAGLDVHTWVVLAHNSRLGAERPDTSVVNAYGDRYPWAPCIAQPATRAYLVDLAAEAAVRPGAQGTELESLGWYGLAHLHAHDKTAGVGLGEAGQYLMSLCFCPSCRDGYGRQGLDADELAADVRRALEPLWRGHGTADAGWAAVEKLLGARAAAGTRAWRDGVARGLQEDAVAAVRAQAPDGFRILLHADPESYHCGANAGVDPAHILAVADGVVVPCTGGAELAAPFAAQGRGVVAANLTVVAGMGGSPRTLAADARRAAGLGATELRLYHAGLASDSDLELIAEALSDLA